MRSSFTHCGLQFAMSSSPLSVASSAPSSPSFPEVHWHDSHRFCTTSTLQFFLYRTRCRTSILVQQYQMTQPLATVMRALFTGGAVGHYHSSEHPLPDPIMNNPIRIVDLAGST